MEKEKPKKQLNKYLQLTSIGFQMGITVYLFAKLGGWLDEEYPHEKKIYTLICVVFAVAISIYSINKQLQRINNSK
jgi:hypothetical protein